MNITTLIDALKTRCVASFGGRVAGAAEYKRLSDVANLVMPAAYVIPLDDNAGAKDSQNGYSQTITDSFAVIVVLSNTPDERGQGSITAIEPLRAVLWGALLGWRPDTFYGPITYEGGQLLDLDRARLYYQFEFSAQTEITEADTWQGATNAALGAFTEMKIELDAIDPRDPNLAATGPDGTIEATVLIQVPQ